MRERDTRHGGRTSRMDGPSDRGAPVGPGLGLLELARDPDEDVLGAVGGDELHADGQAVGRPVQRQADRRLTARVERRRERHVLTPARTIGAIGLSASFANVPIGTGGSPSVGVISRSKPSAHHCCTARRNGELAASDCA